MTTNTEAPSSLEAIMNLQDNPEAPEAQATEEPEVDSPELPATVGVVTVSEMGKTVRVPLEPGMTILETLEAAEINPHGYSLRLNGGDTDAPGNTVLNPGDSIILARQIRGA